MDSGLAPHTCILGDSRGAGETKKSNAVVVEYRNGVGVKTCFWHGPINPVETKKECTLVYQSTAT